MIEAATKNNVDTKVLLEAQLKEEQIIKDKYDGIIFPVNDYLTLSEIIYNLSINEDHLEIMGRNAVKIIDFYSQNRIMSLWNNLIK